ncbi:bifunctional diguanylate cyclase/phosphodiesterase [Ammoniphilus sp. CFH 90114]|uniref:putative bifunctional diguanylate cyclase/phosphodiesterase n=1 Tax=Ammoniphilus sp. CFH 90114 TaxID=2493665 RepID=UPI00100DBB59|nr:bifunctional diguanylate cyclase/phosphodiesterase [Ammoniphilus sp. CFH 90114]RXT15384.1 bifunctional diguanylate cyclase/phosphodiesterase [Ammoniphilus sp. CFH 90114]
MRNSPNFHTAESQMDIKFKDGVMPEESLLGVYMYDQGRFRVVSGRFASIFGYSPEEIIQLSDPLKIFHEDDRERIQEQIDSRLTGEAHAWHYHTRGIKKDGSHIHLEICGVLTELQHLEYPVIIGTICDITHSQQTSLQLEKTLKKLRDIEWALNESTIVAFTDCRGVITDVNDAFCRISKYTKEELVGKDHRILNSGYHSKEFFRNLWGSIQKGQVWEGELRNKAKDGSLYWVKTTIVPFVNDEGKPYQYISIRTDISEQKRAERLNEYLAYTDPLTHLPNRRLFEETLESMMKEANKTEDLLAVFYLDIDRFKYINDTLGHAVGDKLLQSISSLLMEFRGEKDFIARMGGDEFAMLFPCGKKREDVIDIATKIIQRMGRVIHLDEYELIVTTSIGISYYPYDGTDAQTLMKNADAALHRAKEEGKNKYRVYNSSINNETLRTFSIEKELRRALNGEEFILHYQPRVDIITGKMVGAEALIRWNHPEWGMVSPREFIPLAEETGLIIPIGDWVMDTVCQQLQYWMALNIPPVPISVNISAKRFMQRDFVKSMKDLLDRYQMDTSLIEIEVTETSLINNEEIVQTTILKLKELGVKVALDDFGTGYSSLSYLTKYDIDILKIDRSFIQGSTVDSKVRTITTSIIQIAKGLGMKIVAEGVETKEQLLFLQEQACEEVQGFFFSKPVPVVEFDQLMTHRSFY